MMFLLLVTHLSFHWTYWNARFFFPIFPFIEINLEIYRLAGKFLQKIQISETTEKKNLMFRLSLTCLRQCFHYLQTCQIICNSKQFTCFNLIELLAFIGLNWDNRCYNSIIEILNHFWPMLPFYTPWKTQENIWFFGGLRGYKMKLLARDGLRQVLFKILNLKRKFARLVIYFSNSFCSGLKFRIS